MFCPLLAGISIVIFARRGFRWTPKECGERLWDSPQFIVASASAAEVYGVGDFYTQQYEFYSRERKQISFGDIHLSRRQDMSAEATIVEGLPLVPPTRLICDFLREGRDLEKVSLVLQELIQKEYEVHWSDVVDAVHKYSYRVYSASAPWIMGELLKTRIETRVSAHPALDSYLESGEKLCRLRVMDILVIPISSIPQIELKYPGKLIKTRP